jgi:TRAP-type C4-dicarboxylate transport system substrate-binding protein
MGMGRARAILVACTSVSMMALAGSGRPAAAADNPIVIRMTVDNPPGTPRAVGEERFANLVDKESSGRMKVQIFWSGSLGGTQMAALDTVRAGGAEIAAVSTSNFSSMDRTWALFDLPFLFDGPTGLYKYMDSAEFAALARNTAQRDGVHYVFSWFDNWRQLVTTKQPIHTPDQMRGIKLRTTGSAIETAYDTAFGAKPTSVDWGETYLALKNGLVDGYFIGYTTITNFKQDDAVKYGTTLNVCPIVVPLFMNETFYQKLPPDLRKVIDEAGRQAELANRKADQANDTASRATLKSEGMVIYEPTPSEKALWVAKAKPVYAQFDSTFPPGMIAKIQSTELQLK